MNERKTPNKQDILGMVNEYCLCFVCEDILSAQRFSFYDSPKGIVPAHIDCISKYSLTEKNNPTKKELDYMLRYYGICAITGNRFDGYYEADHIDPLWKSGKNVGNFRPLTKDAHKKRTAEDAGYRAVVKSLAGKTGQKAKREKNGSKIQSNRKMESESKWPQSKMGSGRKLPQKKFPETKGFNNWKK